MGMMLRRPRLLQSGGASGAVRFAKYVSCLGDGFHRVRLASKAPDDDRAASGSGSGSGSGFGIDCDPCVNYEEGSGSGDCPPPDVPSVAGVVADGSLVTAYDPLRLPIEVGGVVIVGNPIADEDGDRIYPILNAEYELIAIQESEWECCPPDSGSGSAATGTSAVREKRRRYYITLGCVTPWCDVDPC